MKNWRDLLKNLADPYEPMLNEYKPKGTKKKSLKYNRYNELVTEDEVVKEAELEITTAISIAKVLEDEAIEEAIERAIDTALEIPIVARRFMADVIENVSARISIEEDAFSEIEENSVSDIEEIELENSPRQRSASMVSSLRGEVERSRSSDGSNNSASAHDFHLNIDVLHQNFIGEGSGVL